MASTMIPKKAVQAPTNNTGPSQGKKLVIKPLKCEQGLWEGAWRKDQRQGQSFQAGQAWRATRARQPLGSPQQAQHMHRALPSSSMFCCLTCTTTCSQARAA